MKLNKGTTLITINLIYLGRCKRLGQLKAPYAINILLIVKALTYACVNQCTNDGLGPSVFIGISFYIHFRQLTSMGLCLSFPLLAKPGKRLMLTRFIIGERHR